MSPDPSDDASVSGYISDSQSGETLIGASVSLEGTKLGAITNKSGYFAISSIPPGKYNLIISYVGYQKTKIPISLNKGESVRKTFKIVPATITTGEVSVQAEKEEDKREVAISKIDIPMKEIKKIRVGGETDVFRSLQMLPGILTSSQLSSGLFVRGGSPDQNLVLLDGATVYNPTHLFGFISTFNTDAIKDVELIKGGFPAEYGGRLSAVLNLTQKDGNREEIHGLGSIGVISSKLALEGPLPWLNGSWNIAARRTYLDLILKLLPEDPQNPFPDFKFYDINAKINMNAGDNDKFYLSGFTSSDLLNYASYGASLGMDVSNYLGSARWTHIFDNNLFGNVILSTSKYVTGFDADESGFPVYLKNSITDYTLKYSLEWFASKDLTIKIGGEHSKFAFDFYQDFLGKKDSLPQKGTVSLGYVDLNLIDWNHSLYAQGSYQITDLLTTQLGLRANYWQFSNHVLLDPRIALRYQVQDNVFLKAAFGIFHQNLKLITQNDFSAFDTWLPTDTTIAPSTAYHYIFSVETRPMEDYDLNFDVYYKRMNNIPEMNTDLLQPSKVSDLFYIGNADAYGFEVFLQKRAGDFTGWIGYALGYIWEKFNEINNGQPFHPKYDRTHDLKIVGQYHINDKWEVGAQFTFQSGQSYTGATSRILSRLTDMTAGRGLIFPSQRFGLRLPPSHQLNVNATYIFPIYGLQSRLTLDIYNVYDRRDIWFRRLNTRGPVAYYEDVKLLPIIPTISYEIRF